MDIQEELILKKRNVPHAFVMLFSIAVVTLLITFMIPSGTYDRALNTKGKMAIVEGSYHEVAKNHLNFLDFFNTFFQGMNSGSSIIFFLIITGGTFGIMRKTQALEGLVNFTLNKLAHREIYIIPVLISFFALCSGTYGMIEGSIAYIFILLPLCIRLGYDSLVAVAIPLVGTAIGYTGSFINPFNVGVAQTIADLPLFSGLGYRIVCWFVFLSASVGYIVYYANKIKKDPTLSLMHSYDRTREFGNSLESQGNIQLNRRHTIILTCFALTLIAIIVGVSTFGWYLKEMAGIFFLLGIVVGMIDRMNANTIAQTFTDGCKDMVEGALTVGFAYTIVEIVKQSNTLDTIIYQLSSVVELLPSGTAALGMFGVQSLMNFIVTSGSGQAALTMPIMTPIADFAGVSRQVAVLAFQFGDGISNAFTPTAGWLMAGLTIAKVPWGTWARFIWPLIVGLYLIGAGLILVAHYIVWPAM